MSVLGFATVSSAPRAFVPMTSAMNGLMAVKYAVVESLESKIWLWPTEVQAVEAPIAPTLLKLPEEIIDFSGRWVSTKTLPSGDMTVKALRYDPDLYSLIKSVARNNDGRFQPAYKSWLIPRWRAFIAKEKLRQLSQEVIFIMQTLPTTPNSRI
jgi:competence protein CoiA